MELEQITLSPESVLRGGSHNYKIVDVLGQGGFGVTYLAAGKVKVGNIVAEAKFAIKEHFPSDLAARQGNQVEARSGSETDYANSIRDFIGEARRLQALSEADLSIVKVNEVFEENGTAYYVMQYIEGESLSDYISRKGQLRYADAVRLFGPIFDAVAELHKQRINHLDIKPANIMLRSDEDNPGGLVPVLIDFGLSLHFKRGGGLTTPKRIQGMSEGYSPIEQYAGISQFLPQADVYALAATLVCCLTGHRPEHASLIDLRELQLELASDSVPRYAIDAIMKAMDKLYEHRTASVADLKNALTVKASADKRTEIKTTDKRTTLEADRSERATRLLTPDAPAPEPKKSPIGLIAGIVAIVLVGSAIAWWVSRSSSDDKPVEEEVVVEEVVETPVATETPVEETAEPTEPAPAPQQPTATTADTQAAPARPTSTSTSGTLNLGYGTWRGSSKNGKPNGTGTLTYSTTHAVCPGVSIQAHAGYRLEADYDNGTLVEGTLYDDAGNKVKYIVP